MHTVWILSVVLCQVLTAPDSNESRTNSQASIEPATQLTFNWPDGLVVRVKTERTRERVGTPSAKPATNFSATYKMRVLPHEAGVLVRFDDFDHLTAGGQRVNAAGLQELVASVVPSFVVTRGGEFIRAEDTAKLKSLLTEILEPVLSGKEALPQQVKQILQQLTSDEFLEATAATEWNSLVGAWVAFPLRDGPLEETIEEPNPLMPDLTIPMKVAQTMVETGACARGGAQRECGLFELRSQVNREGLVPLMNRMLEGVKGTEAFQYEDFDVVSIVRVRLELATMLPHELTSTKTVSVRVSAADGTVAALKQIERRTSSFSY